MDMEKGKPTCGASSRLQADDINHLIESTQHFHKEEGVAVIAVVTSVLFQVGTLTLEGK